MRDKTRMARTDEDPALPVVRTPAGFRRRRGTDGQLEVGGEDVREIVSELTDR